MNSEANILRLIDEARIARLAQLDFEQQVHAIPFVFVRLDKTLYSPVDGKPKRHAKLSRLAWVEEAPSVTVLIDEYQEDWTQLWWLRIYGEAKVIRADAPNWDLIAEKLRERYPQYAAPPSGVELFNGEPTMLSIEIGRWRSWFAENAAC